MYNSFLSREEFAFENQDAEMTMLDLRRCIFDFCYVTKKRVREQNNKTASLIFLIIFHYIFSFFFCENPGFVSSIGF